MKEKLYEELLRYFNEKTTFEKIGALDVYQMENLSQSIANFGVEGVKRGFMLAEQSDYLTGRKGCDWRADFDWLIRPQNMKKVLSGKYVDYKYRSSAGVPLSTSTHSSSFDTDEFAEAAFSRGFGA